MPGGRDCHARFMRRHVELTWNQAPEVSNFSTGIGVRPVSRNEGSGECYGVVNNSRN